MSNALIPKQFQHISSYELYSVPEGTEFIKDVTLKQRDKTEFSQWDGYGVAYGFSNAREYSYTLKKLREKNAVGYVTNYYADLNALKAGDRVYEELRKNTNLNLYLTESNPWQVEKTYAEQVLKNQDPTLYEQLVSERNIDKTYIQNKAVIDQLNIDSGGKKRAFLVGNDNKSITSGSDEFQQHAKVTNTVLSNNQRFVRIDTAALSTILGGRLGFNGFGAMGIGRTEFFIQTNNPKLVKEVDQYTQRIEQNKKPIHGDNKYFFASKEPLHVQILKDIKNSTGDIFIHGATLELLGEDPISKSLVKAKKEGRNVTVLSAGGRETIPSLIYLREHGINVSITNKYIPGTSIDKTVGNIPIIKKLLGGASEHSNVVIIKELEGKKDLTVTHLGSARLTGVFTHIKEGRPDTSVEGNVRLLSTDVPGLDTFLTNHLKRRYILSDTTTSKYMYSRGLRRIYEPEFIRISTHYSVNKHTIPYRYSSDKDAVKIITTNYLPNYSIKLPNEHFYSYRKIQDLPKVSIFEKLYLNRVAPPDSKSNPEYAHVYENNLIELSKFDAAISTPTYGQYINLRLGAGLYKPGYGIGGSFFSFVGRQLDNLFAYDDMIAQREEIKRKKTVRVKQFINLHDKPPSDPDVGQFETILNTAYQTASGVAITLGTYTSINLPLQHIKAKFEDVFTEQLFAPGKSSLFRQGFLNTIFFGRALGAVVKDATTRVLDEKGNWIVDPETNNYKTPKSKAQVGRNIEKIQSLVYEYKKVLEDSIISRAIEKGADLESLSYKDKLIKAIDSINDNDFNALKLNAISEIENVYTGRNKGNNVNNSISTYLSYMSKTTKEQLASGEVVISSTGGFSYYGFVSGFRKYDTARFNLLLAPILRNINPYSFSANPNSAYSVYNASIDEFSRTLSLGIPLIYDAEAKGGMSAVRLANTGVQRNMELAKSLDRIGHLLPVNLFYWMPSVRKALKLPEFDNKENIVWADIFSIEQKTKQVEATLNYLGKASGFRWHNLGQEVSPHLIPRIFQRAGQGIWSVVQIAANSAYTISRSVQLYAQQRITDIKYKELEHKVLRPLYKNYNAIIDADVNSFSEELDNTFKVIKELDYDPDNLTPDTIRTVTNETASLTKQHRSNKKVGVMWRLINLVEESILGKPRFSEDNKYGNYHVKKTGAGVDIHNKQVLDDYLKARDHLKYIRQQLVSVGIVEVQEVVNPLDKEANAGKKHLSLEYKPTEAKKLKLKLLRSTLGTAGTLLLTDAALDFSFLNAGVSIFKQLRARHILSLRDLQKTEGLEQYDHYGRGAAHFRFEANPGMPLILGTAGTMAFLGGILFPDIRTAPPKYTLNHSDRFMDVDQEMTVVKMMIDQESELPEVERETLKASIGSELEEGSPVNKWKLNEFNESDQVTLNELKATKQRLNRAKAVVNSLEYQRVQFRFNKKTAWGGFILGLLTTKLATSAFTSIKEGSYSTESTPTKIFNYLRGIPLNSRPDLDGVSSVLSTYAEYEAGALYNNAITVEDLAIAAMLEHQAYSNIKTTERKDTVYNIATQATLPFFQLALVSRVNSNQRTINLGTAFQLNATLGLGISPILPISIKLGEPSTTLEDRQDDELIAKLERGEYVYNRNLTDDEIKQAGRQALFSMITLGDRFVYEKESNFEAAITMLGTAKLLRDLKEGTQYLYQRSGLNRKASIGTVVDSFGRWTRSMPVATTKALGYGTVKNLVALPGFFVTTSVSAARQSRVITSLLVSAGSYFIGAPMIEDHFSLKQENQSEISDEEIESRQFWASASKVGLFSSSLIGAALIKSYNPALSKPSTKFGRYGRSLGTVALSGYTGFFISRLISDPTIAFKGYSTQTKEKAYEATVGIGVTLGLGFLSSGVFTSEESLIEAYKARLKASPDYRSKLISELRHVLPEGILETDYGKNIINNITQDSVPDSLPRVKRSLISTRTLTRMIGARLFEKSAESNYKVVASSRYNLQRERGMQAYGVYALTRIAALGAVNLLSAESRERLFNIPFLGESLKVLSGVGGFDNEDSFYYNYQPSASRFISELFKIVTFNIVNLEPYQDKSDPFFSLPANVGLSFKQSGISSYFQLASTASDLSVSSFNIAGAVVGEIDTLKNILQAEGLTGKQKYLIMRGRKARSTPMSPTPLSSSEQSAIRGSLPLSFAVDVRLQKQANIAHQRPSELALDLLLEGMLSGQVAHPMFNQFPNNKLPRTYSPQTNIIGKFTFGMPGRELALDENGNLIVKSKNKFPYLPDAINNITEDSLMKDKLVTQSGGLGDLFTKTFIGLGNTVEGGGIVTETLKWATPLLSFTTLGFAGIKLLSTLIYMGRRRESLELFEETYMTRSTVTSQASRYKFKIMTIGEREVLAQIDLATGRENKFFALASFEDIKNRFTGSSYDDYKFKNSLIKRLTTSQTQIVNTLNTFFTTSVTKEVDVLLKEIHEQINSKTISGIYTLGPERVQQLAKSLEDSLHNKLVSIFKRNIKNTDLTIGELLYGMDYTASLEDDGVEKFVRNMLRGTMDPIRGMDLTTSLATTIVDRLNSYSTILNKNPHLVDAITTSISRSKSTKVYEQLVQGDLLRMQSNVIRQLNSDVNFASNQLIYQFTQPRANEFDVNDPEIENDIKKEQTKYEVHQQKVVKRAREVAYAQGLYGKRAWGETFLSDIGNYGFRAAGIGINNYLQYGQPIYEIGEGLFVGLDKTKTKQERERGYAWSARFLTYNAISYGVSIGVNKLGLGGIPALVVGGAAQLITFSLLNRDPNYSQREHKFFSSIGDKLVPDDGSDGFHLTPIARSINNITAEVTGPLLAEIHGKDKSLFSSIITQLILPQTHYIEEWNLRKNARQYAIQRFQQTITLKDGVNNEYIHPELKGNPTGFIQEVRYHRYFKTNAFGGRILSEFSLGAYRPSGLMMLAFSRRQGVSDYYLGRSIVRNVLSESGKPPDEQSYRDLRNSVLTTIIGTYIGHQILKHTGIGHVVGSAVDWSIGAVSGTAANSLMGPKYEAVRQANFILEDVSRMLGLNPEDMPVIEYGGVEVQSTYYEEGKIVLSHEDALDLASRRTSNLQGSDLQIKHTLTHELIHHHQFQAGRFTDDLTGGLSTPEFDSTKPLVEQSGKATLDKLLELTKSPDAAVRTKAINIIKTAQHSTLLAYENALASGIELSKQEFDLIYQNEIQATVLATEVIELGQTPHSQIINTVTSTIPGVDLTNNATTPRGLSSPNYIVNGSNTLLTPDDHTAEVRYTVLDSTSPEGIESNTFTARQADLTPQQEDQSISRYGRRYSHFSESHLSSYQSKITEFTELMSKEVTPELKATVVNTLADLTVDLQHLYNIPNQEDLYIKYYKVYEQLSNIHNELSTENPKINNQAKSIEEQLFDITKTKLSMPDPSDLRGITDLVAKIKQMQQDARTLMADLDAQGLGKLSVYNLYEHEYNRLQKQIEVWEKQIEVLKSKNTKVAESKSSTSNLPQPDNLSNQKIRDKSKQLSEIKNKVVMLKSSITNLGHLINTSEDLTEKQNLEIVRNAQLQEYNLLRNQGKQLQKELATQIAEADRNAEAKSIDYEKKLKLAQIKVTKAADALYSIGVDESILKNSETRQAFKEFHLAKQELNTINERVKQKEVELNNQKKRVNTLTENLKKAEKELQTAQNTEGKETNKIEENIKKIQSELTNTKSKVTKSQEDLSRYKSEAKTAQEKYDTSYSILETKLQVTPAEETKEAMERAYNEVGRHIVTVDELNAEFIEGGQEPIKNKLWSEVKHKIVPSVRDSDLPQAKSPVAPTTDSYMKGILRRSSDALNTAVNNVEGIKLSLSPIEVMSDMGRYLKEFSEEFSSVHGDINIGKLLVGVFGAYDLTTTYFTKKDTNNYIRLIAKELRMGRISEEQAKIRLANLRRTELSSNLSTGTSFIISLFTNSFLFNFLPALTIGMQTGQKESYDEHSDYIKSLTERDYQAILRGEALPSDQTLSLSATAKMYRENKVLTSLIEENDVIQKTLSKIPLGSWSGSALNAVFYSRAGRGLASISSTFLLVKAKENERSKLLNKWNSLSARQRAGYKNFEDYYTINQNIYLTGATWLSAISATAESLNIIFDVGSVFIRGASGVVANVLSHVTGRKAVKPVLETAVDLDLIPENIADKPTNKSNIVGDPAPELSQADELEELIPEASTKVGDPDPASKPAIDNATTKQDSWFNKITKKINKWYDLNKNKVKGQSGYRRKRILEKLADTGQTTNTKLNNLSKRLTEFKYKRIRGFQAWGHKINTFGPVRYTANKVRELKSGLYNIVLKPIGQALGWVKNKIGAGLNKLLNININEKYLAHVGIRGVVLNTLGPIIDTASYIYNSNQINTLNEGSLDYEFPTYYKESGRAAGSLAGSIAGMRSFGFVGDIYFSFLYSSLLSEDLMELGKKRREYIKYYKDYEYDFKLYKPNLLQHELNLTVLNQQRRAGHLGGSLNSGLTYVLDNIRKLDGYTKYKEQSELIDSEIHQIGGAWYKRKAAKFKHVGVGGILAKVEKNREALYTKVIGAQRLAKINAKELARAEKIKEAASTFRSSNITNKGKALETILTDVTKTTFGLERSFFRGFIGGNLIGTAIDVGVFTLSSNIERSAIDIVKKDQSDSAIEAAHELFLSSQRLKGSSTFSLVGTFTGGLAGSGGGVKGIEIGAAIGGLLGGGIGEQIGVRTANLAKRNDYYDYEAISKGQNIGLASGILSAIAIGLMIMAAGVTAPLWLLGLGAFGIIAGGYTLGGHLPIFNNNIVRATGASINTMALSTFNAVKEGAIGVGRAAHWTYKTGKTVGQTVKNVSVTLGKNIIKGAKGAWDNSFGKRKQAPTGKMKKSLNQLSRRIKERDSRAKTNTLTSDNRNWFDKLFFPSVSAMDFSDPNIQKVIKQSQTQAQYLGMYDPYQNKYMEEENSPVYIKPEHKVEVEKSGGFFSNLFNTKWFKRLATFTAFVFSPVAMAYRFGRDFLKNPMDMFNRVKQGLGQTVKSWKDKLFSFWNKLTGNKTAASDGYYDPYAEERAHQHKVIGKILGSIGVEYNTYKTNRKLPAHIDQAFINKTIQISKNLGIPDPDNLMAVMSFESGFSPTIVNPSSGATGLIQFTPRTARGLGTSTAQLQQMNAYDQLDYVEKYYAPHRGKLNTISDLYMATLWPKAIGQSEDYVLFSSGSKEYSGNRGLDLNSDGKITKREAAAKVEAHRGYLSKTSNNQTPKGFNSNQFFEALREYVQYYSSKTDLGSTGVVFPVQGKNRNDYNLSPSQTFSAWRAYRGGQHYGEDFLAPAGTAVVATRDGEIHYISPPNGSGFRKVVLKFSYNNQTYYADYGHITDVQVNVGDKVKAGQVLAKITTVGGPGSGYSTAEHLDIKLWTMVDNARKYIDPTQSGFWNNSINSNELSTKKKAKPETSKILEQLQTGKAITPTMRYSAIELLKGANAPNNQINYLQEQINIYNSNLKPEEQNRLYKINTGTEKDPYSNYYQDSRTLLNIPSDNSTQTSEQKTSYLPPNIDKENSIKIKSIAKTKVNGDQLVKYALLTDDELESLSVSRYKELDLINNIKVANQEAEKVIATLQSQNKKVLKVEGFSEIKEAPLDPHQKVADIKQQQASINIEQSSNKRKINIDITRPGQHIIDNYDLVTNVEPSSEYSLMDNNA